MPSSASLSTVINWGDFNFQTYKGSSASERQHIILNLLAECFFYIAEKTSTDQQAILQAAEKTIESNLK